MKDISQVVTDIVQKALEAEGFGDVFTKFDTVRFTKKAKFGDLQSNHAFDAARARKQNPRAVATRVAERIRENFPHGRVEVAGPGFLNFFLDDSWLIQKLEEQVTDPHLGIEQYGSEHSVVIDYSSPNIAKRMHIGHMRSTIIGNALDRMYRAQGWNVVADNHIGDWGTQFGKLIVAWNRQRDEQNFERDPIGELERLYVLFSQEATEEDLELARHETAKLQSGDPTNRALWRRFVEESMKEFNQVYQRLDISFDVVYGESFYHDMLEGVVANLRQKNIATVSDNAVVVAFPKTIEPKILSDSILVIQKKDGAFLYGTTDLATLDFRQREYKPQKVVYVTDLRQKLHFQQVFHSWKATRSSSETLPELIHVYFGMLRLEEGTMSSRKGNVIRLVELLDEAIAHAQTVTDLKSVSLSSEERTQIAKSVGISAIRYADLSQNPQTDVKFSWKKILSLEGNTAPFLMYSYARARGIQRKGGVLEPEINGIVIEEAIERILVCLLLRFPNTFHHALASHRPNIICDYTYELSTVFNRFYAQCSVLRAASPEQKQSRLALVEATLRVLGKCFSLVGIHALDRM